MENIIPSIPEFNDPEKDKLFTALALAGGWQSSGKTLDQAIKHFAESLNKTLPDWRDMSVEQISATPQGRFAAAEAIRVTSEK